jgi:hypothetical protein
MISAATLTHLYLGNVLRGCMRSEWLPIQRDIHQLTLSGHGDLNSAALFFAIVPNFMKCSLRLERGQAVADPQSPLWGCLHRLGRRCSASAVSS